MTKYLLHYKGKGSIREIDDRATSSDDWGRLLREFADDNGEYADAIRIDRDDIAEGIPYDWGLAGPGGASFTLLCYQGETKPQIEAAKKFLKRTRDVVRVNILHCKLVD